MARQAMVNPGRERAKAKGKLLTPKVWGRANKARAKGLPRPRQGKVKGPLPEFRQGSARPPALNTRGGGQENASANLANNFGWSKADPGAPVAKAMPPAPPPSRRVPLPVSSSHSEESDEEGQGEWPRPRTPPDERVPAEPSTPPKARGNVVKSRGEIAVPQEMEGRSGSSSTSPEPARGSRPAGAEQASGASPGARQPRLEPEPVLQVSPQDSEERSQPSAMEPSQAPVEVQAARPRRPPLRMGASGLPEVPFPDFRAARSYQRMRLPKPVFLASLRLVDGLCCYGCNVSFSVGELSTFNSPVF